MDASKKKAKKSKSAKSSKQTRSLEESKLDPEVEAFVNWFADWWLRRGRRLVKEAKEADPDLRNGRKRSKRREGRRPFHWDEETQRFVLDREDESKG